MKIGDDKIKRIINILLYVILLISVSTPNIASSVLKEQIQTYSSGEKYQFMEIPIIPEMIDNKNPLKLNVIDNLPDSFSWKNYQGKDWATPAKDQGYCGSCWAFAAIGTLESMINIGEGNPDLDIDLSEQYMLSCLPAAANTYGEGCSGGTPIAAFYYMMNTSSEGNYRNGAIPESCFPYQADDKIPCSEKCTDWEKYLYPIADWGYGIPGFDSPEVRDSIKFIIYNIGPVAAGIDVIDPFIDWGLTHHDSEDYYSYEEQNWYNSLNHCIVIVGWKDDPSIPNGGYWICKNSWGTEFGYDGFYNAEYGSIYTGYLFTWVTYISDNKNNPPEKPIRPSGPTSGNINTEYTYTVSTTDSEGDLVSYLLDCGDGKVDSILGWIGPHNSGEKCEIGYMWENEGDYEIRVKAKDEYGLQSEWSEPLDVAFPKNRLLDHTDFYLWRLLDYFPLLYFFSTLMEGKL